jgi:uncharacterized protein DUF6399
VFQRSRAKVEGRNGSVSLRNHPRRGLDLPRKRECCTAMPNCFLTRPDGTTAAARFFGQKPRSMCAVILQAVERPPAPLSPPRQAESGRSYDRGQFFDTFCWAEGRRCAVSNKRRTATKLLVSHDGYAPSTMRKMLDNCARASLRLYCETSRPWPGAVPWLAQTEERWV